MVEYNNFWDGTTLGKAGPYSSQAFAALVQDLLAAHDTLNAGILTGRGNGVDDPLDVQETSPASKQVAVKPGSALVPQLSSTEPKGARRYYTDSDVNVTIPDNTDGSGFDRIDLLVLRSNSTTQTITPTLITGTAAAVPVAPSPVRAGAIYDIILSEITAQNLFTTITNADIDTTVQTHTPVWGAINGGTGIEGGVVKGDLIAGSAANIFSLLNYTANNADVLVVDTNDATGLKYIDKRPTLIFQSSLAANTTFSTPMQIDSESDPAGNINGAIGSNQFALNPGTYIIFGAWAFENQSANRGSVYFNLYDSVAAANVQDTTGNDVQSNGASSYNSSEASCSLAPTVIEIDGTETLEFRLTQSGGMTIRTNNAAATARPLQVSFIRIL